jgi:5-methylcytosine-specific restriction endonuclease McrA
MTIPSARKKRLLARLVAAQDGLCCYCCRPFTNGGDRRPTIEHKKARMDGGKNHVANLAAACLHCNNHRGRQMVRDRLKAKKVAAHMLAARKTQAETSIAPRK